MNDPGKLREAILARLSRVTDPETGVIGQAIRVAGYVRGDDLAALLSELAEERDVGQGRAPVFGVTIITWRPCWS